MALYFDLPKLEIIELEYRGIDPVEDNYHVFNYPETMQINEYKFFYIQDAYGIMYRISKWRILTDPTYIVFNIASYAAGYGNKVRFITSTIGLESFDFIDKTGTSTTTYIYRDFIIKNLSGLTRLKNISILSTDLSMSFNMPVYPCIYKHVSFYNGTPDKSINIFTSYGYDSQKLIGFFNSVYKGIITTSGYIPNFNSTAGSLEFVYLGIIEFALSMSGPWYSILNIPVLDYLEEKLIYMRCGKVYGSLFKAMNSIKVLAVEVV
jgi:hypothetical protein